MVITLASQTINKVEELFEWVFLLAICFLLYWEQQCKSLGWFPSEHVAERKSPTKVAGILICLTINIICQQNILNRNYLKCITWQILKMCMFIVAPRSTVRQAVWLQTAEMCKLTWLWKGASNRIIWYTVKASFSLFMHFKTKINRLHSYKLVCQLGQLTQWTFLWGT